MTMNAIARRKKKKQKDRFGKGKEKKAKRKYGKAATRTHKMVAQIYLVASPLAPKHDPNTENKQRREE